MEEKFLERFMYNKEKYALVIEYFTYILNNNFLLALSYFCEEVGYEFQYKGINFSKDLNNNKIVIFYDFNEEIYIQLEEFLNILRLACTVYIEEDTKDTNEVLMMYNQIYQNLLKE